MANPEVLDSPNERSLGGAVSYERGEVVRVEPHLHLIVQIDLSDQAALVGAEMPWVRRMRLQGYLAQKKPPPP